MPYKDKDRQKKAQHESYLRNKEKVISAQQVRRNQARFHLQKRKGESGCKECGERHIAVLVFHHRDPNEKEADSTKMINDKWLIQRIDEELEKCDVLCANCHRKLHWELDHPDNPEGDYEKVLLAEGKGGKGNKGSWHNRKN